MLVIARYALKSPFHASTMVGVLAILSLFIPLVSVLSGAIVGLIILTQGLFSGARAILVSIIGISIVSYFAMQSAELGLTIGLIQWLPMMVLAEILRRSHSISFTVIAGMLLAMLAVLAQYLLWPESEQVLQALLQQMLQGFEQSSAEQGQQLQQLLQSMLHWTVILMVAVMYSTFIATLMAARWFQAKLAGVEGFQDEFYSIRLGKVAAGAGAALFVLNALLQQDWLLSLLMVYMAAFLYQGLAVLHSWNTARKGKTITWLFLLYAMMMIIPQVAGLVALLGVADNWMNFRAKLKAL